MTDAGSSGARILVVDDDPDIADVVSMMLADLGGYETRIAHSPDAALAALAGGDWDLLLTDLQRPQMTGIQLVQAAQAIRPDLPAIIMTAHATIDAAVDALRGGAVDFIRKPIDTGELLSQVDRAITGARARRVRDVVLAIGAHPDDVEIGAGGTLAGHHARGDDVVILTLSEGAVGGDAAVRRAEAEAAAAILGARLVLLDLEDTRIPDGGPSVRAIEAVVQDLTPTVVYTHSLHDLHQDHRATHHAALVAVRRTPRVYCFESPSSTVAFQPTRFVPIDHQLTTKLQAIAEFRSQTSKVDYLAPDLLEATARYWGRHADGRYAEPFEVIRERAPAGTVGVADRADPPTHSGAATP